MIYLYNELVTHKKEQNADHVLTWKNLENMPREKCQTQAQARHKRPQSVRFPLHKMSRIGKSIKTESITESSFQGLW